MSLNYRIFKSLLENSKYFENKPHIGVGVSGGPDSMALAYLLNKWIKYKKGKLTAIVFDHGIRNNSKIESLQVKKMLTDLDIYSLVIRPNKNKPIKKNMNNARDNRFEGLIRICKKNNILHLFLGHHFDDNIETYLIRKINGSNFEGLGSMEEITFGAEVDDPDDSDDIVETVVLSSAVDDTMYHVDFSSSYSKGDVVCLTVQQTGTTNSYVVGTVAMEFDPTS